MAGHHDQVGLAHPLEHLCIRNLAQELDAVSDAGFLGLIAEPLHLPFPGK